MSKFLKAFITSIVSVVIILFAGQNVSSESLFIEQAKTSWPQYVFTSPTMTSEVQKLCSKAYELRQIYPDRFFNIAIFFDSISDTFFPRITIMERVVKGNSITYNCRVYTKGFPLLLDYVEKTGYELCSSLELDKIEAYYDKQII
jgi:hypothetical protein